MGGRHGGMGPAGSGPPRVWPRRTPRPLAPPAETAAPVPGFPVAAAGANPFRDNYPSPTDDLMAPAGGAAADGLPEAGAAAPPAPNPLGPPLPNGTAIELPGGGAKIGRFQPRYGVPFQGGSTPPCPTAPAATSSPAASS